MIEYGRRRKKKEERRRKKEEDGPAKKKKIKNGRMAKLKVIKLAERLFPEITLAERLF